MMITKMALPRRTFLRGVGATIALPFLDAMVPALTAISRTPASPTRRLGFTYVPNGVIFDGWTPTTDGSGFELPSILVPLEEHRDQVVIVSNLALRTGEAAEGEGAGNHSRASASWLNAIGAQSRAHAQRVAGARGRGTNRSRAPGAYATGQPASGGRGRDHVTPMLRDPGGGAREGGGSHGALIARWPRASDRAPG